MKSILGGLLFDRKPKVPELSPVNLQEAQRTAIGGNIAVTPKLERWASGINKFLSMELTKAAESIMPGYSKLLQTGTEAIQAGVEGNLPEGVARNLSRFAAERGVSTGTAGSGFEDFAAVNLLGRESLAYSLNALNTAERWLSQARSATPLFNFSSMFVSPAQQIAVDQYNQQTQWQHQWLKNQMKAAPEGWEVAVQGLLDWVATTGATVSTMAIGGAMGGMGGMGGMAGGMGGGIGAGGGMAAPSSYYGASMGATGASMLGGGGGGGGVPYGTMPNTFSGTSDYFWGSPTYSGGASYNPNPWDYY